MLATKPMIFAETYDDVHRIGDQPCKGCFSRPEPCQCGGLVHTEWGDENIDCEYWLFYCCDKCGTGWFYKE